MIKNNISDNWYSLKIKEIKSKRLNFNLITCSCRNRTFFFLQLPSRKLKTSCNYIIWKFYHWIILLSSKINYTPIKKEQSDKIKQLKTSIKLRSEIHRTQTSFRNRNHGNRIAPAEFRIRPVFRYRGISKSRRMKRFRQKSHEKMFI